MPFVSHEYLLEVGNCTCVFSVGHSDVEACAITENACAQSFTPQIELVNRPIVQ